MRPFYFTTIIALALLTFASCKKNFLDRTPSVNLTEEAIFKSPVLAAQYADNAYNFLIDEYARFNVHRGITGQASDEAVSGNNEVSIRTLTNGAYHDHYERGGASLNDIGDVWQRSYYGIRVTNNMLARMDSVPWTAAQRTARFPERVKGEMLFIRSFLYFELIKRFGGVPLISQVFGLTDNADVPRNTYEQCVTFITNDLNKIDTDTLLPRTYNNTDNGRATFGAARALKARVLLFAASKLNNETNDLAKWKLAADAADSVIKMNQYTLQATYADILNVASSPEYIMMKIRGPRTIDGFLLDFAMSPGSGGAQGQLNPTQNHVDLYEMKTTGKPISDPTSGYNPQAPYANRDPRLAWNVLCNDQTWQGRRIEMFNGGRDYVSGNVTYTATRYYCRKMWPEAYIRNVAGTALLNFVYFRYAEILLNYAEAKNEITAAPGNDVYAAINQIRARTSVAMPAIVPGTLTQAQMRDRIRNERAVELAFEDFRWYDIMRWKAGPQIVAQPMYGMNVIKNANNTFTYNRELLPSSMQKVYLDYMHRYPIPRNEVYKSEGILLQNPGW